VRFTWDPEKAAINVAKHGVTFEEATEVFTGEVDPLTRPDHAHSEHEYRFQSIGPSARRVLMVVWTERDEDVTRIISARPATPAERALYRKYAGGAP
jgi:uncharacterized DUF497 family protein